MLAREVAFPVAHSRALSHPSDPLLGPTCHRNIKYTLAMMMAVGVGVTLYGYYDVEPEMDSAGVFMRYYRNSIFAISLFLSLRISRAYDRWCGGHARAGLKLVPRRRGAP